MTRAMLVWTILLISPALVGCVGGDEPAPAVDAAVKASAAEAGATTGDAPSAPTEAYAVSAEALDGSEGAIAYPVHVPTNAAREPVVVDFSGVFEPADCRPLNFGPFEAVLGAASVPYAARNLADVLQVGDVFSYEITLAYNNSAQNWGEIHALYGIGSTIQGDDEPTREKTEVLVSWTGQGYRASEEDFAFLMVRCEVGMMTQPIPYTFTARFAFADAAIPAEAPILVPVPENATRLFVRGVAIDPAQGVLSHFRVFGPDDELVCECALSSDAEIASVPLPPGGGDYVLLVDHTSNGFLGIALDAPAAGDARPLGSEWVVTPVLASDGGAVDEDATVTLDRVPLFMAAGVRSKDGAGIGKHTVLTVTNARGEVMRIAWGGHLAWQDPLGGDAWLGFWPADWEFSVDHHAFAPGAHAAHVSAEELRGEVEILTRQYVR